MKKYHDQNIEKHKFMVGDLVLLLNSKLRLFSGKRKSKWIGPFLINKVFTHDPVELNNKEGARFTVKKEKNQNLPGACGKCK